MIRIQSKRLHTTALIFLTLLVISSGAAQEFNFPDDTSEHDQDVDVSVNASSINNINNVTLYADDPNDNRDSKELTEDGSTGNYTGTYDIGDTTSGDYDLFAKVFNGTGPNETTSTITVTLDNEGPSVDSFTPSDESYVNGDNGDGDNIDISYSASDSDTSEDFQNISIEGEGNSANSRSLSDVSLSDGSYTVNYWVNDSVGNVNSGSWDFTVDTSYDGDGDPDLDVEGKGDGEVVEFDGGLDLNVGLDDSDSTSETTVRCYVEDEEVDSFNVSSGSSDVSDSCEIDLDDDEDYYDTEAEIYVEMEDEAGNSETSDTIDVGLDAEPPVITNLDSSTGYSIFNDNFNVSFEASDSVSTVSDAEYFYDDVDMDEGNGNNLTDQVDSFGDAEFEADVSSLDSGNHTLYLRAKDGVGRWSSPSSFDFKYLPGEVPETSLSVPENVTVTAGDTESFTIDVENTGQIFIMDALLELDSEILSDNETISELEPGDTVTTSFEVSPSEEDIGEYSIDATIDRTSSSTSFTYRVKANQQQRTNIESRLDQYESELQQLESNVSELKQKLPAEKAEMLEQNISDFRRKVEEARSSVNSGEYYSAESNLEGIDSDFQSASESYEEIKQSYENARMWRLIFMGIGGIVFVSLGGVIVLDRFDYVDTDAMKQKVTGIELGEIGLDDVEHRIKHMLGQEPEADDFEWDGFRD